MFRRMGCGWNWLWCWTWFCNVEICGWAEINSQKRSAVVTAEAYLCEVELSRVRPNTPDQKTLVTRGNNIFARMRPNTPVTRGSYVFTRISLRGLTFKHPPSWPLVREKRVFCIILAGVSSLLRCECVMRWMTYIQLLWVDRITFHTASRIQRAFRTVPQKVTNINTGIPDEYN
jgi:hypothetical protein